MSITVKPVLSSHSKRHQKLVFKTDYCLMQVKSIAECSMSLISLFCLFLSGCLRHVLLYVQLGCQCNYKRKIERGKTNHAIVKHDKRYSVGAEKLKFKEDKNYIELKTFAAISHAHLFRVWKQVKLSGSCLSTFHRFGST